MTEGNNHSDKGNHPDAPARQSTGSMSRWELVAMVAAAVILCTPFIYVQRQNHPISTASAATLEFAGSKQCASCHQGVYEKWQDSYHQKAMAEASDETVLGDFNNITYTDPYSTVTSRFFRRDKNFYVETEGPDGKMGEFQITHTFGVFPLQQYLVPFDGGRLQCLNIAWNSREHTWYRLPPYDVKGPDDWLHWTKGGQNWNGMCAECHSTELHKGYDSTTESYQTTWFEISVGCEACHGPGSEHISWAKKQPMGRAAIKNSGLKVITNTKVTSKQIAVCAPCHSRRFQLGDNIHDEGEVMDKMVPTLLEEGLYYPDGQIKDEVYVYGSFTQSKMYQNNVRCSDCHNVHSLKTHFEGNDLCLQCHRKDVYDASTHHFHKQEHEGKPSDGRLCVKCHMPARTYMGADYRPDHSLRIPRPDLSEKLGTPNSCSTQQCHGDKDLDWVNNGYTEWYGKARKPHYGEIIALGRDGQVGAATELQALAEDTLLPAIVRATALSLLRNYPGESTTDANMRSLEDVDPLIRYTAIRTLDYLNDTTKARLISPKLYDDVKAIRMEAAATLAGISRELIRPEDHKALEAGLEEYEEAMVYNSDFAPQRYNLGNLAAKSGDTEGAVSHYLKAIKIDEQFFPAKVNLAMLYNQLGKNDDAKRLLAEVVKEHPQNYEIAYSFGLLLAEMHDYQGAAKYLGIAADGIPGHPRARYNQALAFLKIKKWQEGEDALLQAIWADPENLTYFTTLMNLYSSFNLNKRARDVAQALLKKVPNHKGAQQVLRSFQ